ncbi:MAG: hypothetical protein EBT57_10065 [Verrucomicrobia bacterium]|nr:hypothetical protein [Verrucomicrobiota bacterium]
MEEVFDLDGLVTLFGGLGLGRGDRLLGVFGKFVQIHRLELSERRLRRARGIEGPRQKNKRAMFVYILCGVFGFKIQSHGQIN